MLAVYLYLEAFRYNEFGVAAATGWLMVLASLLLAASTCAGSTGGCWPAMRESLRPRASLRGVGIAAGRCVWSVLPIVLVVLSSFRPARDIFAVPPRFLFAPTLENYAQLWRALARLLHRACGTASSSPSARRCSRSLASHAGGLRLFALPLDARSPARRFFLIFIRLLPPIVITLPLFPVVNWLGLNDTHLVLIILYATFFVSLGTWS